MPSSVKEMIAAANAVVPKITPDEARKLIVGENALVVDVRDAPEVGKSQHQANASNLSAFVGTAARRASLVKFHREARDGTTSRHML
ncbi:MAG TPA: hypothetical protein VGV39_13445 [Mesorhizobium sp.]|jgi:hypothetical protein|uniref:hypothetical protein n=1 Tax=Mesorhizobium sp. TaxID=1871066 RepID=UPI002DDD9804|nr:hypothetical protein [Mesorhizobium sp.]HEV2504076.1 hypothetical protein [Mesorhizobium sp.]